MYVDWNLQRQTFHIYYWERCECWRKQQSGFLLCETQPLLPVIFPASCEPVIEVVSIVVSRIFPVFNFFPFLINHRLSMVGLRPSSLLSTGWVVSLRGDWAIFCHAGSGQVGRVQSAREKSLEILHHGWELNPGGQTVSYPTELSWLTSDLVNENCFYMDCITKPEPNHNARGLSS